MAAERYVLKRNSYDVRSARVILTCLVLAVLLSPAAGAAQAITPGQQVATFKAEEEIPLVLRNGAFVFVWETIRDKYYDPTFGGKDWMAIRDLYEPRVENARTSAAFHALLGKMLGELGRSHLAVIAPHQLPGGTKANPAVRMAPEGLTLCLGEGRVMLAAVKPDSPAWNAGLRPGFVLIKAGDSPLPTAEEIKVSSPRSLAAARRALSGEPFTTAVLTVLDENDHERTASLPRSEPFQERANLVRTQIEYRRVRPRVGYIRFDGWGFDLEPKLKAAMAELWDTDGLIIDCRQNRGGTNPGVDYLASVLLAEPGLIAVEIPREGARREWTHKGGGDSVYKGRLAVLIDGGSGSASEVFAASMQEKGRAVVLGQTSVGGVLNSTQAPLPTGGVLQYPHSDLRTPKGGSIEGRGVVPDIQAEILRADLLRGKDSVIEKAADAVLGEGVR